MMPQISIIVPIYKVEKYLRRCLDSILTQTFNDFECILVDDGSPDDCPAICDEYAKKDNRIIVIHKEKNMGLAEARASGLNKSVGKFIMHVDSDDWIEQNALELLCKKQQESDADIVLGSIKNITFYGNKIYINPEISDNIQPISYFLIHNSYGLFAKLYKKSLYQNYIVPDMAIGEDIIVNAQIFSAIQPGKLQKIDETVYSYDRTINGLTNDSFNNLKRLTSYLDSPHVKCRLWVKHYITNNVKQDSLLKIACLYIVYEVVADYAMRCKNVTKSEIDIFYKDYHQKLAGSKYIKRISFHKRIIIPIFYFSMPLGKTYVFLLHTIKKIIHFLLYYKRKKLDIREE
jgi:glycosyltransferase involved in cell wall biosynthesis